MRYFRILLILQLGLNLGDGYTSCEKSIENNNKGHLEGQVRRLLIVLLITALATAGYCADIRVPEDQQSIQAAINAAQNGDRVIVARGEYVENISFAGKRITVRGIQANICS